jgi:heat shock protein HslJ/uncharacterized lipoprotein YbaY
MKSKRLRPILAALMLLFATSANAQTTETNSQLAGTSWQLVKFEGGDDTRLTPDDKGKYTIALANDDSVSVRIDCNHGHGIWKSSGPPQLEFGPLALTRAMCPAAPLTDRIPRDWQYVRSYILKDGHLFLSLMADAGIYEFEPMASESPSAAVTGTATYRERMALPPDAVFEATLEDVSKADAPAQAISRTRKEDPGNPPFAFEIPYNPPEIDPTHTYSVRARITSNNELLFTTTQNYPVLTGGNQNQVTLLLQRSTGAPAVSSTQETSISGLPATFVGTLPCADCPGIRYQLNLLADHTFIFRTTYENRNSSFREDGTWLLANDGKILVLQTQKHTRQQFALLNEQTLRQLDANAKQIESKLNYDLRRAPHFLPIEQPGHTSGQAALENTHWKLTRLGQTPLSDSPQQEPYVVLDPANQHVSGSGGCNRITGTYKLKGNELTFSRMVATMMACMQGMDTERKFLKTLGDVTSWKITGHTLQMFDDNQNAIAEFEAVQTR